MTGNSSLIHSPDSFATKFACLPPLSWSYQTTPKFDFFLLHFFITFTSCSHSKTTVSFQVLIFAESTSAKMITPPVKKIDVGPREVLNNGFVMKQIPGRGNGLVATRAIETGEQIMFVNKPLALFITPISLNGKCRQTLLTAQFVVGIVAHLVTR